MSVKELIADPRIGAAVASGTVGTGTIIDVIPDGIGKVATVIGILLSILLIRVHYANLQKIKMEVAIMKRKEEERREAAKLRKEEGLALRRVED